MTPLAIVGGLIVLSVVLLVLGGVTYGPAGLPRSLQVTSVWLALGGTLVCFLYSCAPAFSTQCTTWDADLRAYDFGIACIDAIAAAVCCAMLFTLGTFGACPGLTPPRGAFMQGGAAVLLLAKLAVGIFRFATGASFHPGGGGVAPATTDAPELKVCVMGASAAVAALSCALCVVQWVALKQSIASTFMAYTASCADGRVSGTEGLLDYHARAAEAGLVSTPYSQQRPAASSPLSSVTPVPDMFPDVGGGAPGKRDSALARPRSESPARGT